MRSYYWIVLLAFIFSCQGEHLPSMDAISGVDPNLEGQWVNMIVEIPAGSTEKWEVNKATGQIERDSIDGQPRTINYLGYPGNYGFIPQTLLPKKQGGDGDPLDILVIGESVERGTVLRCKIVGVLKLLDDGEQDDKLIAIAEESPIAALNNITDLKNEYRGMLEIIETWFSNYKGDGVMESQGYAAVDSALNVLSISLFSYQN